MSPLARRITWIEHGDKSGSWCRRHNHTNHMQKKLAGSSLLWSRLKPGSEHITWTSIYRQMYVRKLTQEMPDSSWAFGRSCYTTSRYWSQCYIDTIAWSAYRWSIWTRNARAANIITYLAKSESLVVVLTSKSGHMTTEQIRRPIGHNGYSALTYKWGINKMSHSKYWWQTVWRNPL